MLTFTSITFLIHNLALNPDIQEVVYEEIMDLAADQVDIIVILFYLHIIDAAMFNNSILMHRNVHMVLTN